MPEDKVRSVYELIAKEYRADVTAEDLTTNLSIGTSDLIIAQNDPKRLALIVVNLSANILYLRPFNVAAATAGIRLAPSGGAMTLDWKTDFHLPAIEWHAVASGAASAIYVTSVRLL